MNINKYLCNMKVLIGLFLANSIGLIAYDYAYDYNSPRIDMTLRIYLEDRRIEGVIMKPISFDVIFVQHMQYDVDFTVVRLL